MNSEVMTERQNESYYRMQMSWRTGNVRFLGLPYSDIHGKTSKDIRLSGIYVPLTFHSVQGDIRERIQINTLLLKHRNVVLFGGPGSGKSLICQVLAYAFSREGESLTRKLGNSRIPIWIKLRDFRFSEKTYTLESFLSEYCDRLDIDKKDYVNADWLISKLRAGRALLLLDSMDEVGDQNSREKFRQFYDDEIVGNDLLGQGDASHCNFVVITSRFNDGLSLLKKTEPYIINRFDRTDINQFIRKWYQDYSQDRHEREAAEQKIQRALKTDPTLKVLASTPLLLLLLLLVSRIGNTPVDIIDLYGRIMDAYLIDIPRAYGVEVPLPVRTMKRCLAKLAASSCYTGNDNEIGKCSVLIHKSDIEKILEDELGESADTDDIIDYFVAKTGLLVRENKELYSFAHASFQEYLTAWHLRGMAFDAEGLERHFVQLVSDPQTHEVALWLFGLMSEFSEKQRDLFRVIYEGKPDNVPKARFLSQMLFFCADLSLKIKIKIIDYCLKTLMVVIDLVVLQALDEFFRGLNPKDALYKLYVQQVQNWFDRQESDFSPTSAISAIILYPNTKELLDKIKNVIYHVSYCREATHKNNWLMDASIERMYYQADLLLSELQPNELPASDLLPNDLLPHKLLSNELLADELQADELLTKTQRTVGLFRKVIDFAMLLRVLTADLSPDNKKNIYIRQIISYINRSISVFSRRYQVNIELNYDKIIKCDNENIKVNADLNALEAIVYNLVSNAIKYTNIHEKCGLIVQLQASTNDSSILEIIFEDNGIGIPEEDKEKIFEVDGYRSDKAKRLIPPGMQFVHTTLYQCRQKVKKMGGELTLESCSQPTRFVLALPIVEE